jgi:hypothetical protein
VNGSVAEDFLIVDLAVKADIARDTGEEEED